MGTIKKVKDHTLRYVVVPSFTLLAVVHPEDTIGSKGLTLSDLPDKLVNIGTVFQRPDIFKTVKAHSEFVAKALGSVANVTTEAIKFCDHDKLDSLFKSVNVFDATPKAVALEVAKSIRK